MEDKPLDNHASQMTDAHNAIKESLDRVTVLVRMPIMRARNPPVLARGNDRPDLANSQGIEKIIRVFWMPPPRADAPAQWRCR
jgi:hypothetical protein